MVAVFWVKKGVVLVNFLPRGSTVNWDHTSETQIILNAHLCWVCPTTKMSEVLLLLDNTRPHTSVCIVEAITRFRWIVLLRPPYIPDCEDFITPVMRHCRMLSASGCSGGIATFGGWVWMLLFKGEKRQSTNMDSTMKNNCAFSNVVTKYCEIFMCQILNRMK
jgi:hypothetical protein